VLVLRFYERLTDAVIAETLGCATSTVRAHASRALASLRLDAATDLDLDRGPR
jgi:DNA-directed RNA polymerase specialized sigma24 family protein